MKRCVLLIMLLMILAFSGCKQPEIGTTPSTTTTAPVIECKKHMLSELSGCCRICGMPYFEVALEYELNETKDGYVVMGPGISKRTDIVIPATYKGLPVTEIGEKAFYYDPYESDTAFCNEITSVVIPGSVTKIGKLAFAVCGSLKTVELSKGLKEIGESAFAACGSLTELVIPEGVTTIGYCAFYNSPQLIRLELPDSVTTLGVAAIGLCPKLTSIRIPSSITEIPEEFAGSCTSLKTVEMGPDVSRIATKAFAGCTALETFDCGSKVTFIGSQAFDGCTSLTTVNLSQTVKEIGSAAFKDCTLLSSINIPDAIEILEVNAFAGCTAIPCTVYEGMKYFGTAGSPYMILLSKADENVMDVVAHKDTRFIQSDVLGQNGINSISLGEHVSEFPFTQIRKLEVAPSLIIDPNNKHYRIVNNCLIKTRTKTLLQAYEGFVIPEDGSVTVIGDKAFAGLATAEVIIIPDCVVEVGVGAFTNCAALRILVFGSGVQKIGVNVLSSKNNLSAVYFKGTKDAWENMEGLEVFTIMGMQASNNPTLLALPCYFYSETQVNGTGYWHYVDGEPTLW